MYSTCGMKATNDPKEASAYRKPQKPHKGEDLQQAELAKYSVL